MEEKRNQELTMQKLNYLDGLRVIACIAVFLSHFTGAFCAKSALFQNMLNNIQKTPFFILINTNVAVPSLFIISGAVLSYKYFAKNDLSTLTADVTKRYFRLSVPVFIAVMSMYVMMKLNLLYNQEAAMISGSEDFLAIYNVFSPNFVIALKEALYGTFFKNESLYIGPLWTMTYEMLGSYLVFAFVAMLRNKKIRYVFYFMALIIMGKSHYSYFIAGMIISDIICNEVWLNKLFSKYKIFTSLAFCISFIYVSMNSYIETSNLTYMLFKVFYIIMIISIHNNDKIYIFFGNRPMVWLSKYAFSIYLVHWPIILTFSSWFVVKFVNIFPNYFILFTICFLLTIVITAISAYALTHISNTINTKVSSIINRYVNR